MLSKDWPVTEPRYPAHPLVGATPMRLVSNGSMLVHPLAGSPSGCAATRPKAGTSSLCLCKYMTVEWTGQWASR